jgi:CubicO group peptidase (beta-lactamase class C family)
MTKPPYNAESPHIDRIARIEAGLQVDGSLRPKDRRSASLADRMAHYKTPAVSVAVIEGGEVAWAKNWGVR